MAFRISAILVCSAVFLAGLHCVSAGMDASVSTGLNSSTNTTNSVGGSSGETKRNTDQTNDSRIKRKTLAVDLVVPSLLRYHLAEFIKRPLNGECLSLSGCYTVRANLRMLCVPLQKLISTFVADSTQRNVSDGQLPFFHKRPLSKVLKLEARKSNQVVVEIGEDLVKTGCGGLSVYEEAPVLILEMDLTSVVEWWLGVEGGRLRVRLIPEKKAQVPAIEDRYAAAIRAADPRLFLQMSASGKLHFSCFTHT